MLRRSQVDDALRAASQYLTGSDTDGPVRIYHQSFRDYLLSDGPHCVYGEEANAALTDGLIRRVPLHTEGGRRDWLGVDFYTRTHLATHAAQAGRIDELLDDVGFLAVADPDRLLPALANARAPATASTVRVYRHAASILSGLPPKEAAAHLQLHARQLGDDELAERIDGAGLGLPGRYWGPPGARCTPANSSATTRARSRLWQSGS